MTGFIHALITALYAMLIQNLVLTAVYGLSETIKIAKRPKYLLMSTASVAFYSISTTLVCYFLDKIKLISSLSDMKRFLVYILVLAVIYILSGLFCVYVLKANNKFMNSLGICAFNSLVLAVPMINFKANYSFAQALGNAIGAALAFLLAILLINAGMRHIAKSNEIPPMFRTTAALLIYTALLSLALSCLSGQSLLV